MISLRKCMNQLILPKTLGIPISLMNEYSSSWNLSSYSNCTKNGFIPNRGLSHLCFGHRNGFCGENKQQHYQNRQKSGLFELPRKFWVFYRRYYQNRKMNYFVIGVSGVTCGGKTTMSKLLQRSFPWARMIHQDKYFYPEDYPGHVRIPEIDNHINFDCWAALDMDQMCRDVEAILQSCTNRKGDFNHNQEIAPNFAEGLELLRNLQNLDIDTSKYSDIPILIIEGFTMFESEDLYDKCDVRFFLTLDKETARLRRELRVFDPPDGEGYFDYCIWPEYKKHFKSFVENRPGIHTLSGKCQIGNLWKETVEIIIQKMEEKFPCHLKSNAKENL